MTDRELRDQQLFDQIASAYAHKDETESSVIARQYRVACAVQPILDRMPDLGVVVDLGCGVGAPARYLHGRYQQYIGIDQSAELIAAAERFTQGLPQVQFKMANAKSTELPDNTADVILSHWSTAPHD
ncbi:MAG: class I SAM-dependent methyltransferase [Anaerolineae bacterium]|nr:class I SAM-dependent methyltransferase [Anaerolineae bacterium]